VKAAIFFTLILALGGGGFYYVYNAKGAGEEYGQYRYQDDCFDAVLHGRHVCKDAICYLENRFFLDGCLAASMSASDHCASIPRSSSTLGFTSWKNKQCASLKRNDRSCDYAVSAMYGSCN